MADESDGNEAPKRPTVEDEFDIHVTPITQKRGKHSKMTSRFGTLDEQRQPIPSNQE